MVQCEDMKDDDRPINSLEHFVELEEVLQMIDGIQEATAPGFEKDYEKYTEVLSRYQEQPHLLDKHLHVLVGKLLTKIRISSLSANLIDACFKYLYTISKVRTYKALVKFLPHELPDLEFALDLLEKQDPKNSNNWETRYILLLWMSILVLNPFHMSRLDAYITENSNNIQPTHQKTKMERIFNLCMLYTQQNDTCSSVAAFLTAKYLIRADIKDIYLEKFFDLVIDQNIETKLGQLAAISAILKHGKREDLLQYANTLLRWLLACDYKNSSDFLKYKYYIKIIQRIGMLYLKPIVASWRYKRGVRSLVTNLTDNMTAAIAPNGELAISPSEDDEDDNEIAHDEIEEVIEELLQGIRSSSSDIRWNAAKGIGRVTSRFPRVLGDDIIGSIIDILNPIEPHEAWHGACLALAELAKRGLLLPYRLKELIPLLMQALFYDEMKGYMSVGQHIRDSACYMCWAFARAYDPSDLQPFVNQIAAGLLTVAAFDREINCRRAASAAFQESVGRLGNFPYGIEISTTTDFYSVGLRQNSFLQISDFISQYDEYKKPLIDHLIERKVGHWDIAIRELTAKSLNRLTHREPSYMASDIIPKLFAKTDSIDINSRHGAVLAIGEIIFALKTIEIQTGSQYINTQIIRDLSELLIKFLKREQFRGMSGEIMKQCCTDFIRNCSKARINVSEDAVDSWQDFINKCIINKNNQIRETATIALTELCEAYYNNDARFTANARLVYDYIKGSDNDLEEHIRMGFVNGLGAFPKFILRTHLEDIMDSLIKHALPPTGALQALLCGDIATAKSETENSITFTWSEARRDSVKALSNIVRVVGFDTDTESMSNGKYLDKMFDCFLTALEEYTLDNRGDIGAWVREAAMSALAQLLTLCPHELLKPNSVHQIMVGLAQQAVEKIDRTRGLAGKLFCNLITMEPQLPYIKNHERLLEIFPTDSSTVLWLFADHTFPFFCAMLELEEYSPRLILGLTASIGQLTESLIKYSSSSFFQFLRSHPNDVPRICDEILSVFEQNSLNERVTYPILNFLDILLSSGTISTILMDEKYKFADEVFRLVNYEIKGHKKLYKLTSSINVYCQLIQVPRLSSKILSKMAIFLGLTHVHVRKTTATKLYEALALYGESTGVSEENLDEALNCLSENDWGLPLTEVRIIRNQICDLLGVKVPVSAAATSSSSKVF